MTLCAKQAVASAYETAGVITPSVLSVARLVKITPVALAEAIRDNNANALYLSDVAGALVKVLIAEAEAEATDK